MAIGTGRICAKGLRAGNQSVSEKIRRDGPDIAVAPPQLFFLSRQGSHLMLTVVSQWPISWDASSALPIRSLVKQINRSAA